MNTVDNPALEQLAHRLRVPMRELDGLSSLGPEQSARLCDLFSRSEQRQKEQMRVAIDNALRHVPRLLRGPIIRILRGQR